MKKILKFAVISMAFGIVVGGVSAAVTTNEITQASAEETLNEVMIDKTSFNKNDSVTVNAVTAASNRYAINIFLKAGDYCDAPVAQIENNPSEFDRVGANYDKSMTKENFYAKMANLNIYKGYLEIDQTPVTSYSRSSLGFWDNPIGRCYLGKTSANQFQLHIDVCCDFASGYHSITLKKGTQIPTFAYFTNLDTAKYTKNTVLVMPETVVWQINSSLTSTWIGTTEADKTMVSKVGFSQKGVSTNYENTTANRSAVYFDLVSYYSKYNTNGFNGVDKYEDADQYRNNFHIDYHDAQASDCRSLTHKAGALHTLRFWNHVLIDDKPAYTDWNDSRIQLTFGGAIGGAFGRLGLSFVFKGVDSCKTKDTFTVTLLKGIEIPTPSDRNEDKAEYMTTDVTYKFSFKAIQSATVAGGQKSFDCVGCETLDTELWDAASEATEVISAHMVQHSANNTNGRLVFKLSNYDFNYTDANTVKDIIKNVNEEYQLPVLINQSAANYYSNILFDGQSCISKISNYKTVLGYHGVGFIADFPWNNPTISKITIKAGTRFPAQSYCFPTPDAQCYVSDTPKFYTTSSDVTLTYDKAQNRWTRTDLIKEVTPTALRFTQNAGTTSMNLSIHLDGADYSATGARTVNAVMRKTDNMWTGIKFDGTPIVDCAWEGTSGTYDRSSRSTVNKSGIGYHEFQMLGNYLNPGISEVFIPAGTYFYSSAMLDQGAGVKEIYVTKSDVTFYNYKDATTYGTADEKASYEYAAGFLSAVVCDGGITAPSTTAWAAQGTSFSALSSGAKALIVGATAKEDGTKIEQAVARYDYIIAKYGTETYANFMSRSIAKLNSNINILNFDDNTACNAIVIICSITCLSLIGGFIAFRKRKSGVIK